MQLLRFATALLACLASGSTAAATLIAPEAPVAGERVLMAASACWGSSPSFQVVPPRIDVEGEKLYLRAQFRVSGFAVGSCERVRVLSDPVPAGTYDAVFSYAMVDWGSLNQPQPVPMGRITVSPQSGASTPLYKRLSGNWFDPAAPGSGVNLVQGASGGLFAAWLTHPPIDYETINGIYGVPGYSRGSWYVMSQGMWVAPNVFRGPLFITRAESSERTWDPKQLGTTLAGFASFTFTGPDEMRFEAVVLYNLDSKVTTRQTLRRFRF
jgi:hypothetical protein